MEKSIKRYWTPMKYSTGQKINFLLVAYFILCLILELIVFIGDLYDYVHFKQNSPKNEFKWESFELIFSLIGILFIVVIPNVFSIIVHDLKRAMNPPINKWSLLIKNLPLYLLIAITIVSIFIMAIYTKNDLISAIADKFSASRMGHQNKRELWKNLALFGVFMVVMMPVISLYNWIHYIGVKAYRELKDAKLWSKN